MEFEWDGAKSDRNERERGLPFSLAKLLFGGNTIEFDDRRRSYGERRIIAIGEIGGDVYVCVYTWRGTPEEPVRRIISLRPATQGESNAYRQSFS